MHCHVCDIPIEPGDRFCSQCGLPAPAAPHAARQEAILVGDVDAYALTTLQQEKERITGSLQSVLETTGERVLTPHERKVCAALYERWRRVSEEIAARIEYFCRHLDVDRHSRTTGRVPGPKQQVAIDISDWSGPPTQPAA